MTYYEFLVRNRKILTYLNLHHYDASDFYRMRIYEKFLDMHRDGRSVKETLLTMEQQGYGSVATIKRVRRRMEESVGGQSA